MSPDIATASLLSVVAQVLLPLMAIALVLLALKAKKTLIPYFVLIFVTAVAVVGMQQYLSENSLFEYETSVVIGIGGIVVSVIIVSAKRFKKTKQGSK